MNETADPVEVNDPELLRVVERNPPVERLCTGFRFSEGPIGTRKSSAYFSDMPGDIRRRWSPRDGVVEARNPSHKCNGMTYDGAGNLYVCEHVTSSLVMETPAGGRTVLASHWQGRALNSPNDVVVRSDAAIYFTDPTYGRTPVSGLERKQELDFQGVFRVLRDGTLHCDADDFSQPNGLCLSLDETILYVNDTTRAHIRAFDVAADGSLSRSRIFAQGISTRRLRRRGGGRDEVRRARQRLCHRTPRNLGVRRAGPAPGRHSDAGDCRNLNWGGRDWREIYSRLFDVDLSRPHEMRGSPVAYIADGVAGAGHRPSDVGTSRDNRFVVALMGSPWSKVCGTSDQPVWTSHGCAGTRLVHQE